MIFKIETVNLMLHLLYKNKSQNLKANRNLVSPRETSEMDLADSKMGELLYWSILSPKSPNAGLVHMLYIICSN